MLVEKYRDNFSWFKINQFIFYESWDMKISILNFTAVNGMYYFPCKLVFLRRDAWEKCEYADTYIKQKNWTKSSEKMRRCEIRSRGVLCIRRSKIFYYLNHENKREIIDRQNVLFSWFFLLLLNKLTLIL